MTSESNVDNELFTQDGKSALQDQYSDITTRRMECINIKNNLRTWLMANYYGIPDLLFQFLILFGGLYDATWIEVKEKKALPDELKKRIDELLYTEYNPNNFERVKVISKECLSIHNEYEQCLMTAGFRKVTYMSLKPEQRWRGIG